MKNILLLLMVCFGVDTNSKSSWKLIKDKDGIQIYSSQFSGYKLKQFKAKIQINKDADTILAALQDTEACSEWVYKCISNDMVDMSDVKNRIYHTIIDAPLWFKNRDFFLQSHVSYEPVEKLFKISFVSKPHYSKESKDKVRIMDIEMIWSLKYITDEMTSVTYQVYIDPRLPVKRINHLMIQKSIYHTLLGLKKIVDKPVYAETKYSKSDRQMLIDE